MEWVYGLAIHYLVSWRSSSVLHNLYGGHIVSPQAGIKSRCNATFVKIFTILNEQDRPTSEAIDMKKQAPISANKGIDFCPLFNNMAGSFGFLPGVFYSTAQVYSTFNVESLYLYARNATGTATLEDDFGTANQQAAEDGQSLIGGQGPPGSNLNDTFAFQSNPSI